MGDAKRRKQLLGNAYGQTSFIRIKGDRQFQEHFEKFCRVWEETLKAIGGSTAPEVELSEAEIQAKDQEFQTWLTQYLQDYQPQDRESLVGGMLDFLYAQMEELEKEEDPDKLQQQVSKWVLDALTLFALLKPHLSNEQQRNYAHPLLELYEIMVSEVAEEEQEEARDALARTFAVCLDVPGKEE